MKSQLIALLAASLLSGSAYAGQCVVDVYRNACPGKEAECYKKCDGKQDCKGEIKKKTSDEKACAAEALKQCTVFRKGVTKTKKVTATFDGKPVSSGNDACQPEKAEFNWGC